MSTSALPDLSGLSPNEVRMVLRVIERSGEIIEHHTPNADKPQQEISPMATIKIEALAHLSALVELHKHGEAFHRSQGNDSQASLWRQDTGTLQNIWKTLASLPIN